VTWPLPICRHAYSSHKGGSFIARTEQFGLSQESWRRMLAIHLSRALSRPRTVQVLFCAHAPPHLIPSLTRNLTRISQPTFRGYDSRHPTRSFSQQSSGGVANEPTTAPSPSKLSILISRFLPSAFAEPPQSASSFKKIAQLAKQERKPLTIAVGLLFVSSSVSMSIPFTIGKLIDFFSSASPVCHLPPAHVLIVYVEL
jgi:hypothetical protein